MGTPYLSEIKIVSFNFAPKGWAMCNGQLLPINQNQALYSLLGTTYGGDGRVTFGLPDFRGRAPVHIGQGIVQGQRAGEETHTLITSEMPAHNHFANGTTEANTTANPTGTCWGQLTATNLYSNQQPNTAMHPSCIANAGGSQPHSNLQPFLVLNFIIALQGIFPSPN